ncbi:MAG: motif protein [Verrucomicrobia bacterium]|nr:motif protein [Verrucomicrobiota bacterium]
MKLRLLFFVSLGLLGAALSSRAQVVYTWVGSNDDGYLFTPENWLNGVVPVDDIVNTQLTFGNTGTILVHYTSVSVNKLTFSGNTKGYFLEGGVGATHIGSSGILYAPSGNVTSTIEGHVVLEAAQTWTIQSGTLLLEDYISDNTSGFRLTKIGAGNLTLADTSSNWTGGLTLTAGSVTIYGYSDGGVNSLGDGDLIFNGGTLISLSDPVNGSTNDVVSLFIDVQSNGLVRALNFIPLNLNGQLTLNANTTIDTNGADMSIGDIVGPFSLTLNGNGRLYLYGANTYTGGTTSLNGLLVFNDVNALPATPVTNAFTAGANGYIGISDVLPDFQADFIDRFNKAATFGTIGVDYDVSTPIDLTGFSSTARLGSTTNNGFSGTVISGTITPQGTDYRFGGGAGYLEVDSDLTGARNVVVTSPASFPLSVFLTSSANTFTGTVTVINSALVFADLALPSGSRNITVSTGGYVGTQSADSGSPTPDDSDISVFLNHISLTSVGMIGFDTLGNRDVNRPIDLSPFTGALYLGTSEGGYYDDGVSAGTVISGAITTTNGGTDPYRFAAYKGSVLEISSTLSGSAGVVIGDPNSPATFSSPLLGHYSTVILSGDNSTLTGNITLYGGLLAIGQSNGVTGTDPTTALGTGTVIVQPMTLPGGWSALGQTLTPGLIADLDVIVSNPFMLNSQLRISSLSADLTLNGKISGAQGFYMESFSNLTLSNDTSDFTGGIYVGESALLHLAANHASGAGVLSFGSSGSQVYFDTAAPVIGGLSSGYDEDYTSIRMTVANAVLTINQAIDSNFYGEFRSTDFSDTLRLVKTGTGTLTLNADFNFNYGTIEATLPLSPQVALQINQGAVVLQSGSTLNSGAAIWVHGGTLTLNQVGISSGIYVDNGGRLQGSGLVFNSVTLSNTSIISPGVNGASQVGELDFDTLTLMGGAKMEFSIKDPNSSQGIGWDVVGITDFSFTLHIDSSVTAATPFTIKLYSLDASGAPGTAVGFLNQTYTWTLFDATNSSIVFHNGSFDPTAFVIDASAFSADIGPGTFAFTQSGNLLQLNFTPVPEPSTYALLGSGLALLLIPAFRRKK